MYIEGINDMKSIKDVSSFLNDLGAILYQDNIKKKPEPLLELLNFLKDIES